MVLVAQLSTSSGVRAPLSQIANQVFLDLASELERQQASQKVIADMFGMALRSYQQKMQRIFESTTEPGKAPISLIDAEASDFNIGGAP